MSTLFSEFSVCSCAVCSHQIEDCMRVGLLCSASTQWLSGEIHPIQYDLDCKTFHKCMCHVPCHIDAVQKVYLFGGERISVLLTAVRVDQCFVADSVHFMPTQVYCQLYTRAPPSQPHQVWEAD